MSHNITATLFYGRSSVAVEPPAITFTKAETFEDSKLAALCLAHMSKQAGGFLTTMAQDVRVGRHPQGSIQVDGAGWQVRFEAHNWAGLCKAEAEKGIEGISAFVSQFTTRDIPASELVAYVVSLRGRGRA